MAQLLGRGVTTASPISYLIRRCTGSSISHVEWRMDGDWHAVGARMIIRGARNAGVLRQCLGALALGDSGTCGAHLEGGIRIRPTNYESFSKVIPFTIACTDEQKRAVMEAALAMVGDAYSKRVILGDLLHIDLSQPHEADCSEFLTETANRGVRILRTLDGVGLITPRDVLLSPVLEIAA